MFLSSTRHVLACQPGGSVPDSLQVTQQQDLQPDSLQHCIGIIDKQDWLLHKADGKHPLITDKHTDQQRPLVAYIPCIQSMRNSFEQKMSGEPPDLSPDILNSCRPVQIFRHTLSPGLGWNEMGKSGEINDKSRFLEKWKLINYRGKSFSNFLFYERNGLPMKYRYKLIGHTLFWDQWKLRYGQASPGTCSGQKGQVRGWKCLVPGVGRAKWAGLQLVLDIWFPRPNCIRYHRSSIFPQIYRSDPVFCNF